MADPELTVVIVSHAGRAELAHLLSDLERARAAVPLRVRVVDNASPDDAAALVRSGFPWVALEALDANVGFGTACNRALAHVDTPLTLLLNPDCRVQGDAIAAMCADMAAMPDVGILSPRVERDDGAADVNAHRGFPTLWGVLPCHRARPGAPRGSLAALHAGVGRGDRGGRGRRQRRRDAVPHGGPARGGRLRRAVLHVRRGHRSVPARAPPGGACTTGPPRRCGTTGAFGEHGALPAGLALRWASCTACIAPGWAG
ncbi:MAG: glycosyltransferase [Thermoleophilia bacterium]